MKTKQYKPKIKWVQAINKLTLTSFRFWVSHKEEGDNFHPIRKSKDVSSCARMTTAVVPACFRNNTDHKKRKKISWFANNKNGT